jgi:hypothetical protein
MLLGQVVQFGGVNLKVAAKHTVQFVAVKVQLSQ